MPKVKRFFLEIEGKEIKNKPLIFPPKVRIYSEKEKIKNRYSQTQEAFKKK